MSFSDAIATGIVNLILFMIVYGIREAISQEGIKAFLINWDTRGWKQFGEGSLVALGLIGLYSLAIILLGKGSFELNSSASFWSTTILYLALAFGFMAVSLFEEGLFRGYLLPKLLTRYSKFTAIGIPAVFFGGLHYSNYAKLSNYPWIGVANATLIAVLLSVVVIRTGSLMWALGFHLSWNLHQAILLVPGPANVIRLNMVNDLMTGSRSIPEAGCLVTLLMVLVGIYVKVRFGKCSDSLDIETTEQI